MKTLIKIGHYSIPLALYIFIAAFITSEHYWVSLIMQIGIVLLAIIYIKFNEFKSLGRGIFFFILILIAGMIVKKDISRGFPYVLFLPLVYLLTKRAFKFKALFVILPIIIYLNSFLIFPNYFALIQGLNYPKSIGTKINSLNFIDKNQSIQLLDTNKTIVLDFWTTSCAQCFKKFPKFNNLTKTYENENLEFYVVNVPTRRDKSFDEIVLRIDTLGYSFKQLYIQDSQRVEDILDFNTYPKVLLIQNGIVKNTKLEVNDSKVIFNNLEYELKKMQHSLQ